MTVMTALRTARTIVTLAAVSLVATVVVSAGASSSATGDHPAGTSATKEWKKSPQSVEPATTVLATKEWKMTRGFAKRATKEW